MAVELRTQIAFGDATPARAAVEWKLPRHLGHTEIAEIGDEILAEPPAELLIEARRFESCEPTAEPHLLDLLSLASRLAIRVRLTVHSAPGSSALARRYERLFTGPLAGFLFARFAGQVLDERGNDHTRHVRALIRNSVNDKDGSVTYGEQRTALITRHPSLVSAQIIERRATKTLRQRVLDELRALGLTAFEPVVTDIATCIEQAVENVHFHAGKLLPASQPDTFGFLTLRRVMREDTERLVKTSAEPLRGYWERHAQPDGAPRHLQITVADNGSGIAATMAGTRAVYDPEQVHDEEEQLIRALGKGTRIRSSSQGRGLGFPQILDAVTARGGLLIVRTGRLRAHAYRVGSMRERDSRPQLDNVQVLPYPVGTTLAFVFPDPSVINRSH